MLVRTPVVNVSKKCEKSTYINGPDVTWRGAVSLSGWAVLSRAGEKAVEGVGCSINCKVDIVCHT